MMRLHLHSPRAVVPLCFPPAPTASRHSLQFPAGFFFQPHGSAKCGDGFDGMSFGGLDARGLLARQARHLHVRLTKYRWRLPCGPYRMSMPKLLSAGSEPGGQSRARSRRCVCDSLPPFQSELLAFCDLLLKCENCDEICIAARRVQLQHTCVLRRSCNCQFGFRMRGHELGYQSMQGGDTSGQILKILLRFFVFRHFSFPLVKFGHCNRARFLTGVQHVGSPFPGMLDHYSPMRTRRSSSQATRASSGGFLLPARWSAFLKSRLADRLWAAVRNRRGNSIGPGGSRLSGLWSLACGPP